MRSIIVHIPKGFSADDWSHNYINVMPMGVFSIANYAVFAGHSCRVMNAAVYECREHALELVYRRIEQDGIGVVGLPLHWHLSGYDVCFAAEQIKDRFPECRVVLGGITATIFAKELLNACPAIDAVVMGDGEVAFASYLDVLDKPVDERDFGIVPNLCLRTDAGLFTSAKRQVDTDVEMGRYNFSIADCIYDVREYAGGPSMFDVIKGKRVDLLNQPIEDRAFFINIGRGCSLNCVYCAGSSVSFARYFHRQELTVRPAASVVRTVLDAVEVGFSKFHICFDAPFSGKDDYFAEIFTSIAAATNTDLSLLYETYNLPSRRFLDSFASSFNKATIMISPCFVESSLMQKYKGYHFTRSEMEDCLTQIGKYPNLNCFVYFAITCLENWNDDTIRELVLYMKQLKNRWGCQASAMPILAEPGSPWVAFGSMYADAALGLGFADFYREWQRPLNEWNPTLCNLPAINEVFARIGELMQNESLT